MPHFASRGGSVKGGPMRPFVPAGGSSLPAGVVAEAGHHEEDVAAAHIHADPASGAAFAVLAEVA